LFTFIYQLLICDQILEMPFMNNYKIIYMDVFEN